MKKVLELALILQIILGPISLQAQYEDRDYPFFTESVSDGIFKQHPVPIVSLDSLTNIIRNAASFPEMGKRKQLSTTMLAKLEFDKDGKIQEIPTITDTSNNDDQYTQIFEPHCNQIINAIRDKWRLRTFKLRSVTLPIRFQSLYNFDSNKIYYAISIFQHPVTIVVDSSNSFNPVFLKYHRSITQTDSFKNFHSPYTLYASSPMVMIFTKDSSFGTVRLGFKIGVDHEPTDIQVVHSYNPTYDSLCILEFNKMKENWIAAHHNGEPYEEYQEMDFRFISPRLFSILRSRYAWAIKQCKSENYAEALPIINEFDNFFLDLIELKFNKSICLFHLDQFNEACKMLDEIKSIAIEKPYPKSVKEEDVNRMRKEYCGIE